MVIRLQAAQLSLLRSVATRASQAADLKTAIGLLERACSGVLDAPVELVRVWPLAVAEATGAVSARDAVGTPWMLRVSGFGGNAHERATLRLLGHLVSDALVAPALRDQLARAEHIITAAFAFSRGLTKVGGGLPLLHFIIETMADASRAEVGSLAVLDPDEGQLRIAVTHGYPSLLVEHVRLGPGEGILGRVLETRRPLLVRDIEDVPGLTARSRYRTRSCVAVPLLAGSTPIGVVAFADRLDGQPFDETDVTALRALAAPAALALQNDRLAEHARELAHAATVDPLTGLFNRRHFQSRIDEEIERARRQSLDLALLLIDIDDFKRINDTLGHLAGDFLLRQVADVLKHSVRVFDVCTRYGGEEFAVLMPGSNGASAMVVAERIRTRVESAVRGEGPLPPHVRVTVSAGLAVLERDGSSADLIARADRALYRAKEEGKNRVRVD
ncbi:MAG: diguanylate cyclase [Vicinamibacterales bacterium]